MHDDKLATVLMTIGIPAIVVIIAVSLIAGNIVNQIFAPAPSLAGPLGAGVALVVFVFLLGKGASLVIRGLY